jgi:hypothetical protein
MKNILLILLFILSISCSKDDDPDPAADTFIGSWFGELSGQGIHIDVSFDVSYSVNKDEYTFRNVIVDYAKVPYIIFPSGLTYRIDPPKDKFAANDGFGQIDIWGFSDDMWVLIRLQYVKIIKNRGGWTMAGGIPIDNSIPYVMMVSDVLLEKVNTNSIILKDQVFIKTK